MDMQWTFDGLLLATINGKGMVCLYTKTGQELYIINTRTSHAVPSLFCTVHNEPQFKDDRKVIQLMFTILIVNQDYLFYLSSHPSSSQFIVGDGYHSFTLEVPHLIPSDILQLVMNFRLENRFGMYQVLYSISNFMQIHFCHVGNLHYYVHRTQMTYKF